MSAPTLRRFVAEPDATARRIREFLRKHPDLKHDDYEAIDDPLDGHCYAAHEAYFHARGAYDGPLDVYCLSWSDVDASLDGTHWFLGCEDLVIDLTNPTDPQQIPWNEGTRRGFMSRTPANRTQIILNELELSSPELEAP